MSSGACVQVFLYNSEFLNIFDVDNPLPPPPTYPDRVDRKMRISVHLYYMWCIPLFLSILFMCWLCPKWHHSSFSQFQVVDLVSFGEQVCWSSFPLLVECVRGQHFMRWECSWLSRSTAPTPGNIWLLSSIKFQLALNLDSALKYLPLLDGMNSLGMP